MQEEGRFSKGAIDSHVNSDDLRLNLFKGGCSNFKYIIVKKLIKSAPASEEEMLTLARCDTILTAPPANLNAERYFGEGPQRDFDSLRRYRIDNVHIMGPPEIKFELKEEHTQFRLAALPHAQIEFDVELVGKVGNIWLD